MKNEINYKERYEKIVEKINNMYNEAADVLLGKKEGNDFFHEDYYVGIMEAGKELALLIRRFDSEKDN